MLVVACHLTACPECRHRTEIVEALGGVLLEQLPAAQLTENCLPETLSRLDAPPPASEHRPPPAPPAWAPEPLHRYRLGHWCWIGPGIRQIVVVRKGRSATSARLLWIAAGSALPEHGHSGMELACVLHGSLVDERGRFAAGDFAEADRELRHRPVAGPESECICLVAIDGPLLFAGPAGRLFQSLLRF